ncbi:hypothetical protein N5C46_23100 [Rossellomorea vietnamensis]|uniref:Uncharacterized protein n=1 Tax=Rossellomorea vietnamensis TaxID=218284 RepID=A0ACD4C7I1_9BACI|nr:hypothetical protein [Rossellomorea vietnamensis]UXH44467.1 hypothetical protein N5C46_23100 [Rossellomorea vietnamensis]
MKTSELLSIKSDLNRLKLKLINMGLSLEDIAYSKEDALSEVLECILTLDEIDSLIRFESKYEV